MAGLVSRFAYRPAIARGRQVYELEGGLLHLDGGWTLDLSRVERAVFVQHRWGDAVMRRLDLVAGGELRSLALTVGAASLPDDADARVHRALMTAVAEALAGLRPGLAVTIGEHGLVRRLMFGIGAVSMVAGLGIAGALLAGGSGRIAEAAMPLGLLVLMGGGTSWSCRPNRPLPQVEMRDFGVLVASLDTAG